MTSYNPNCGHVDCYGLSACIAPRTMNATVTWTADTPAAPAGLDVGKAANDVRHGGHHLDSYWEGFNDGVDALEARLRAASQPSEGGPADG